MYSTSMVNVSYVLLLSWKSPGLQVTQVGRSDVMTQHCTSGYSGSVQCTCRYEVCTFVIIAVWIIGYFLCSNYLQTQSPA